MNRITSSGSVFGTVYYLSPEQALGQDDVDHRADIWGFCAVLYECIVGRAPFGDREPAEALTAIVQEDAPPPSRLGVDDEGLEPILMRGLSAIGSSVGPTLAAWDRPSPLAHGARRARGRLGSRRALALVRQHSRPGLGARLVDRGREPSVGTRANRHAGTPTARPIRPRRHQVDGARSRRTVTRRRLGVGRPPPGVSSAAACGSPGEHPRRSFLSGAPDGAPHVAPSRSAAGRSRSPPRLSVAEGSFLQAQTLRSQPGVLTSVPASPQRQQSAEHEHAERTALALPRRASGAAAADGMQCRRVLGLRAAAARRVSAARDRAGPT